jgi:hypothetical protein
MIANVGLLLLFGAVALWICTVLIHAVRTGEMWARGGNIIRAERAGSFWVSFTLGLLGLLFALAITLTMVVGILRGW